MSESPPPTALPARVLALKSKEADRRRSLPTPQSSQATISRKRRQSDIITHTNSARPMRERGQASAITDTSDDEDEDEDENSDSELSDVPSESNSEIEATPYAGGKAPSSPDRSPSVAFLGARSTAPRVGGRPPPRKRPSPPRTFIRPRPRPSTAAPPAPSLAAEPESIHEVSPLPIN